VLKMMPPLLQLIGVYNDNWQATGYLVAGAMAKEVAIGTLNTPFTAESVSNQEFDAASLNLLDNLDGALRET
jgi:ferrous iron transport protein B